MNAWEHGQSFPFDNLSGIRNTRRNIFLGSLVIAAISFLLLWLADQNTEAYYSSLFFGLFSISGCTSSIAAVVAFILWINTIFWTKEVEEDYARKVKARNGNKFGSFGSREEVLDFMNNAFGDGEGSSSVADDGTVLYVDSNGDKFYFTEDGVRCYIEDDNSDEYFDDYSDGRYEEENG